MPLKPAAKLPRPRTAPQSHSLVSTSTGNVETSGVFTPTDRQMKNFRAKILEQNLGSLPGACARSDSTQGSPTPGHQIASKAPEHRLSQGLKLSGFRRWTKELILFVTPRPTQFSPRFCDQQETEALFALRSFPTGLPIPSPNILWALFSK